MSKNQEKKNLKEHFSISTGNIIYIILTILLFVFYGLPYFTSKKKD